LPPPITLLFTFKIDRSIVRKFTFEQSESELSIFADSRLDKRSGKHKTLWRDPSWAWGRYIPNRFSPSPLKIRCAFKCTKQHWK